MGTFDTINTGGQIISPPSNASGQTLAERLAELETRLELLDQRTIFPIKNLPHLPPLSP